MKQERRFTRRTCVRHFLSHRSVLLVALILGCLFVSGVPVAAADSELDPTFGDFGIVITDQNEFDQINDLAIQSDGKIVTVGHTGTFNGENQQFLNMMVVRYNIDGSLDPTFGNGGIVVTDVGPSTRATAVALQEDGKIVVAGGTIFSRFVVVRYNTDGSLDPTFGAGGIAMERIGRSSVAQVMDVAIQSDGMIVVAGAVIFSTHSNTVTATLARFDSFGFLDFTFGDTVSNGIPVGVATSPMANANSIALQSDQKIAVAGDCLIGSVHKFCLARHNSDGSLDNTFDGDGLVVTDFDFNASSTVAKAVSLQPDGKILAAGETITSSGPVPVLARFNADGLLDTSFGINGDGKVMTFEIGRFQVGSLALKPNGKIVIVGAVVINQIRSVMAAEFYTSDGRLEDFALTPTGPSDAAATAVAVQSDGRVVVGGYGNFFTDGLGPAFSDFALVRYGTNEPPVVSITSPASGSIFAVNTPVDFSGTFVDEFGDTHTAEWSFESTTQSGKVAVPADASSGFVSTTHTFTEPGIYKVSLKVTDDELLSGTATTVDGLDAMVVIYDPNGGWVAGGGWIDSPAGAFALLPESTGKANFGFVSKYQNGASAPTGNVQFQFNAAGLKFKSTSYEWLVISGGRKAQYKGVGMINDIDSTQFMLTAIDGDQPGGGGQDKFRIRIWSNSKGLIYDNQLNAPDSFDPTTVLGGGNIVIHH